MFETESHMKNLKIYALTAKSEASRNSTSTMRNGQSGIWSSIPAIRLPDGKCSSHAYFCGRWTTGANSSTLR